jgi:hypothetical protein
MKIFGIGLSKTGTTSLTEALKKCGFSSRHYPPYNKVLEFAKRYDSLTDTSVIPFYKQLDDIYPDAKFILTIRDMSEWLESCRKHWKKAPKNEQSINVRKNVYGIITFDEIVFKNIYKNHVKSVVEHFNNRKYKLLIMDIPNGDGYDKLCPFLKCEMIHDEFPKLNVSKK